MKKRYDVKITKQDQIIRYSDGTYSKRVDMTWYAFVIRVYADSKEQIKDMITEKIEWIEEV